MSSLAFHKQGAMLHLASLNHCSLSLPPFLFRDAFVPSACGLDGRPFLAAGVASLAVLTEQVGRTLQ